MRESTWSSFCRLGKSDWSPKFGVFGAPVEETAPTSRRLKELQDQDTTWCVFVAHVCSPMPFAQGHRAIVATDLGMGCWTFIHTCDHMAITQFPTPLLNTSVPRISRRSMVVTVVEHSWLSFGAPSLREPSSTPRIRIASASHLPRNQVQPSGTLDARLDPVSATGSTGCWTRSHGLCHRPDRAGWDEVEMTGELSADTAVGGGHRY